MKILLVKPNCEFNYLSIPLGLGYIASAIKRSRKDEVEILDAKHLGWPPAKVSEKIRQYQPEVVGITSYCDDRDEAHKVAGLVKAGVPNARVIIGGPYVTTSLETVLEDANVDFAVVGEGDDTIVELLNAIESGTKDFSRIPGIIYRDGEPRFTGYRPFIEDLDRLVPAWDLLNPESYFKRFRIHSSNHLPSDRRVVPIFTSRGCPYKCIFCHNTFGKKFRARSPESVLEEMLMLKERYGVKEIEILDDAFNINRDRAIAILKGIVDRKLGINLSSTVGFRGDRMDEELIDWFKRAGLFRVTYALESASLRVQKLIKKNIDIFKVKETISMTAKRGIITMGSFIMGFPTETAEEMKMTADFAADSDLHLANFYYLTPFPGTELGEQAGLDKKSVIYRDFTTISLNLSAATDQELHAMNKYAYRRFYLNPKRIARIVWAMPKNLMVFSNLFLITKLLTKDSVMGYSSEADQ